MIYLHPTVACKPALVESVRKRTGYRAVVVGKVVKLVPTARQEARALLAQRQPTFTPDGAA